MVWGLPAIIHPMIISTHSHKTPGIYTPAIHRILIFGAALFILTQSLAEIYLSIIMALVPMGSPITAETAFLTKSLNWVYWFCLPMQKITGAYVNGLINMTRFMPIMKMRFYVLKGADLAFWTAVAFVLAFIRAQRKTTGTAH